MEHTWTDLLQLLQNLVPTSVVVLVQIVQGPRVHEFSPAGVVILGETARVCVHVKTGRKEEERREKEKEPDVSHYHFSLTRDS